MSYRIYVVWKRRGGYGVRREMGNGGGGKGLVIIKNVLLLRWN